MYLLQHFFTGIPSLAVVFAGSLCSCAVDLISASHEVLLGGSLLIFALTFFFHRTPSTVLPA